MVECLEAGKRYYLDNKDIWYDVHYVSSRGTLAIFTNYNDDEEYIIENPYHAAYTELMGDFEVDSYYEPITRPGFNIDPGPYWCVAINVKGYNELGECAILVKPNKMCNPMMGQLNRTWRKVS